MSRLKITTHIGRVSYTGGGQKVYQQEIVIYRSEGTSKQTKSGNIYTWHIYIGAMCRTDYADIRFYNEDGAELMYYRRPGHTADSCQFCVRLPDANLNGNLYIEYNDPNKTTTTSNITTINPTIFTTVGNHTFTVPPMVNEVEVLVVGGGGNGGTGGNSANYGVGGGGGGGGGGVVNTTISTNPNSNISVTVGGPGSNSVFGDIIAIAGGIGGNGGGASSGRPGPGGNGGSGGGGGGGDTGSSNAGGAGGLGTTGQGTNGSNGANGSETNTGYGGRGGAGGGLKYTSTISGTSLTYGIGGSGGDRDRFTRAPPGSGGSGYFAANGQTGGGGGVVIAIGRPITSSPPQLTGFSDETFYPSGNTSTGITLGSTNPMVI